MNIYKLINKKKKAQKAKAVKTAALTAAIGVTAGAAAGVLFAPKSGKETREDIAKKSVEAKDALVEKVEKTKNNVSDAKVKIAEYLASKRKATEEICQLELDSEAEDTLTEEVVKEVEEA